MIAGLFVSEIIKHIMETEIASLFHPVTYVGYRSFNVLVIVFVATQLMFIT